MIDWVRKFLYRIFCAFALLVSVYLVVDFMISGTFELRVFIMFLLMVVVIIWGIIDWRNNYILVQRKETELRMYQMYIQPLEELVKEVRAKQHEFDNHINAILNMHLTVDNYDELVSRQSEYITEAVKENDGRQYLPLLKISDKVLAGFLYSKIVRSPGYIRTELEVRNLEIISGISEHHLIEIVGTLVDNAYEACTEELNRVIMILDSQNDKVIFEVKNRMRNVKLEDIGHFFEKGYSTKSNDGKRGLGLYNAKVLTETHGGEITVSTDFIDERNFICFKAVV